MSVFGIAIFLSFFAFMATQTFCEFGPNNLARMLAFCITLVGLLGFLGAAWINFFPPEPLDHFELPNTIGGDRLTAPDGRVFVVSPPTARVQRYGPEGFEKGFSYQHKASAFGMSASGNVLICSSGQLIAFSPDGAEVPPRGSCPNGTLGSTLSSYQSHAKVPAIAFNRFSALAVPLWHPLVGWFVAAFGGLLLWLFSRLDRSVWIKLASERRPTAASSDRPSS